MIYGFLMKAYVAKQREENKWKQKWKERQHMKTKSQKQTDEEKEGQK
jgi:hypothetical protein